MSPSWTRWCRSTRWTPSGPAISLARRGFLFGGSTGTVVSGAMSWLARHDPENPLTAVAIAPDLGERYLDTIYQTNWIEAIYGKDVLRDDVDVPVHACRQTAL